ncbi:BREX-6 system BrxE protein [Sorangium sp. So ce448]|uniref:BREX-6 system BrxE protein n=1 Tax=Sorangium sp. So ce448 TaxID=3133314 RepID=UPI003F632885
MRYALIGWQRVRNSALPSHQRDAGRWTPNSIVAAAVAISSVGSGRWQRRGTRGDANEPRSDRQPARNVDRPHGNPRPDETLDAILAMQVTTAWAGEGRCSSRRLGWWDTDLIDDAGGGDLFARLLPQTYVWASLEAALRTDAKARAKMADPDKLRTLYFLGFELDEQLGDGFAAHKRSGRPPAEVLPLPLPLTADFAKEKLVSALQGGDAASTRVPEGGRSRASGPTRPTCS